MGLGFTAGLTSIGIVRELIGSGKIFNFQVLPDTYEPITIFILAPVHFCSCGSDSIAEQD